MGNDRYALLDLEHDCRRITPEEAVRNVVPFEL